MVVVATIGDQPLGPCLGRQRAANARWHRRSGNSCVTSLRLLSVTDQANGRPRPSVRTWCLDPGTAAVDRARPAPRPLFRLHVAGVDQRPRPVDLTPRPATAPATRDATVPTPPPAATRAACAGGHAAAEAQLLGRCSQPIPVCSTNRIPCSTRRSSSAAADESRLSDGPAWRASAGAPRQPGGALRRRAGTPRARGRSSAGRSPRRWWPSEHPRR